MKRNKHTSLHRITAVLCAILMLTLNFSCFMPAVAEAAQTLTVNKSSITFGGDSHSATVTVSGGPSAYTASSSYGWIHPTVSGKTVTVRVDANYTGASRYGSFVVKSGSQSRSISVTQYRQIKVYSGSNYNVLTTSVTMPGVVNKTGSPSMKVRVDASGAITAGSTYGWISTSVSGAYITITLKPNTTLGERRGTISISNGYDTKTFTVIQQRLIPDDICTYPYMGPTSSNPSGLILDVYKQYFADAAKWRNMTLEQQAAAIYDFTVAVQKWFGIYGMYPNIDYEYCYNPNSSYNSGVSINFSAKTASYMMLNAARCKDDPTIAARAVIHECRHLWQMKQACYGSSMMNYLFQINCEHYITAEENYIRYATQFLEIDADAYASRLQQSLQRVAGR